MINNIYKNSSNQCIDIKISIKKNIIYKIIKRYDKIPPNNIFNIIKYKFTIINKTSKDNIILKIVLKIQSKILKFNFIIEKFFKI